MYDMKEVTRKLLQGCVVPSTTGVPMYTPDGKASYGALWTRDFAYMAEYAGDLIPAEDIRQCIEYLLAGENTDGWMPDRVEKDGFVRYAAGDEHFPARANLDNGSFLVIAADVYLDMLELEAAKEQFLKWKDGLCRGIDCFPVDERGIIQNVCEPSHSPYGFTDCIRKTGLLSMETLILWRSLKSMVKWDRLCGLACDGYERKIESIEGCFGEIFSLDNGMLLAATGDCRQIDVWGSCYAVSIGFPLPAEQKRKIAAWLCENYDGVVQNGHIRHLPGGTYWERTIIDVEEGTYQNGAYWAVATGWFFDAVKGYDRETAVRLISDVLNYFETWGIFECINGPYRKLDTFVTSATNVYAVYEEYLQLRNGK